MKTNTPMMNNLKKANPASSKITKEKPISKEIDSLILSLLSDEETKNEGFDLLLKTYSGDMIRYCKGRLYIPSSDEQDFMQDWLERIYRYFRNFRSESSFKTWMFSIAYNLRSDYLSMKKSIYIEDNFEEASKVASIQGVDAYLLEKFQNYMAQELTDIEKEVFDLHEYKLMGYKEIAETLNLSVVAVGKNYRNAKALIQAYLDKL